MRYTAEEVMQYVAEEDVKFIRLAFCDVFGRQKNISIMPPELKRAFEQGIAFDASAVKGFGGDICSDLFLHPDPDTLSVLPWRPEQGRVVRMYCAVKTPGGRTHECDTRSMLIAAATKAAAEGLSFRFSARPQFCLYKTDRTGERTYIPFDKAGYLDIAPLDKGENVRRQICLNLEKMGIYPESSCHRSAGGQNEISFRAGEPLATADNVMSFVTAVKTAASSNGLIADFSPEPADSRFIIGIRVKDDRDGSRIRLAAEGIERYLPEMAPYLSASAAVPSAPVIKPDGSTELILPDPSANPYVVLSLLLRAATWGITRRGEGTGGDVISRHIPENMKKLFCEG